MKIARSLLTAAALSLLATLAAQAQKAPAQPAGGEMSAPQKADEGVTKAGKPAPGTADRKALQQQAAAANKSGQTDSGECSAEQKADAGACKRPAAPKSTTARAEVKKEAAAATKAGQKAGGEK